MKKSEALNKILYLTLALAAIPAWLVSAPLSMAQEERPQITPLDKKLIKKKVADPRAVGLLQLTSNGHAKLVPIAILINGKFYDAASYKASPVPMSLETGIIYEGERTGNSLGLFTVNGALHSKDPNSLVPWIATGMWLPTGTEVAKTTRKAEAVPVGLDTNATDAPPRLTKSGNASASTPPADTTPPASTPPSTSTTSASTAPSSTSTPAGQTPASSTNPPAASDSKPADQSKTPPPDDTNSNAGDTNRPKLRRGKPTEPLPEEDVPGYAKLTPGSPAPKPASGAATKTEPPTPKGALQLVPAISDASGPDPRPYTFEWIKGEEEERRKQMLDLAKEKVRAYLAAQAKAKILPTPAHQKASVHKLPAKSPDPILDNVQLRTFDLWVNNQPILVLTADATVPTPVKTGTGVTSDPLVYSITLVTLTDIYQNLHVLYSGVTDKYHLDITPRLELIDAVDADGDGRGELLFRQTSDNGSGYVIYRASQDKLWKLFDSLNPE